MTITFAYHLESKATNWLPSFNAMQKAHHCKSFKGGMTFLDKGLVKKMTDLLGTFYCIAHTLEHLSLHRLAYFSHSNKNPFGL
jgi:hypothetical protein